MIEITRADECGPSIKQKIVEIFVDSFNQWLSPFSKDRRKLERTFRHIFRPKFFYIALIDGEVAGIAACTNGMTNCLYINKRELKKHLGLFMGIVAGNILKKHFEKHKYPFEIEPNRKTAFIEFVATSSRHRGKGVATALMTYLLDMPEYKEYVLEVADTNTTAIRLYEKLGFREFNRVGTKHAKHSGINYFVYMKKQTEEMME